MTQSAITVTNVAKDYLVGRVGTRHATFYELLAAAIRAPARRLTAKKEQGVEPDRFWALKDINFTVEPGQVLGVIGRNGAGKSTLLKILSRITAPSSGRIEVRGRLASLLEVGTGFHPELSGRENIFLNGAILGMSREEVDKKFDEIVAFAEVERFIDTPVKRYSSGMYVRLAFAVAAHLETDILLVDEVLAVGDAAFQRKSLGKMGEVARGGRTVVFVSHNLAAMRNLCTHGILLENGKLTFSGGVLEAIAKYEAAFVAESKLSAVANFTGSLVGIVKFDRLTCTQDDIEVRSLDPMLPLTIEIEGFSDRNFDEMEAKLSIFRDGVFLGSAHDTARAGEQMVAGRFISRYSFPSDLFRPGRYTIGLGASTTDRKSVV